MKSTLTILLFIGSSPVLSQTDLFAEGGQTNVNWNSKIAEAEEDGPGLWYNCVNPPSKASTSSSLPSQGKYTYQSNNLMDSDPRTAWVEGKKGYGIGEFIDLEFDMGGNNIYIYNGYQVNYSIWKKNSRVKSLKMYIDGEYKYMLHLKDLMGGQYFSLPNDLHEKKVRFVINSVFKGDKWDDVCISEINTHQCCLDGSTNIQSQELSFSIETLNNGNIINTIDITNGKISKSQVLKTAKQIHHEMLKIQTKNHQILLTPNHPLFVEGYGFISLYKLKNIEGFASFNELKKILNYLFGNPL